MMFTARELQIIAVLARDAAEDASIVRQSTFEHEGVTDAELQAYVNELKAIAERAEAMGTTMPEYAPDDGPPIEDETYEPTEEDLAELDATFDPGQTE